MASVIIIGGDIDRSIYEVVPTEDLFGPQLEGEQEVEIATFRQGHLALTEAQKALHRLIIVIDVGVLDERVDSVHLQRDLPVDRNLASHHRIAELPVVHRDGRIGQCHINPLAYGGGPLRPLQLEYPYGTAGINSSTIPITTQRSPNHVETKNQSMIPIRIKARPNGLPPYNTAIVAAVAAALPAFLATVGPYRL